MTKINFNGKDYTQEALAGMSPEALLTLRNEVATSLDIATIDKFKDPAAGLKQTWKALERTDSEPSGDEKPKKEPKTPKAPKKPRELAKSAMSKVVKRPTIKMFAALTKSGEHDGSQGRAHRWANYTNGMTIVDVIEKEGTEPWDVYAWEKAGIMTLKEPTEDEFKVLKAAFYKRHNLVDPDATKEQKAADRVKAKAERETKAAEAKTAREAKAAEKKAATDKAATDSK